MRSADINLDELPLGQVTSARIDKAREVLGRILTLLESRPAGGPAATCDTDADGTQQRQIFDSRLEV
jgi:hypothetical protein